MPYKLIVTTNPGRSLGSYATMLEAAEAFAQATEPSRVVIFDDGRQARELNDRETTVLLRVCRMLAFE